MWKFIILCMNFIHFWRVNVVYEKKKWIKLIYNAIVPSPLNTNYTQIDYIFDKKFSEIVAITFSSLFSFAGAQLFQEWWMKYKIIFFLFYFDRSFSFMWFDLKWYFLNFFLLTFAARSYIKRQKSVSISRRSTKWFDSTIEISLWSRWLFECTMSTRLCWIWFKWSTGKTEVIYIK